MLPEHIIFHALFTGFSCCAATFIIAFISIIGTTASRFILITRWAIPVSMLLLIYGVYLGTKSLKATNWAFMPLAISLSNVIHKFHIILSFPYIFKIKTLKGYLYKMAITFWMHKPVNIRKWSCSFTQIMSCWF